MIFKVAFQSKLFYHSMSPVIMKNLATIQQVEQLLNLKCIGDTSHQWSHPHFFHLQDNCHGLSSTHLLFSCIANSGNPHQLVFLCLLQLLYILNTLAGSYKRALLSGYFYKNVTILFAKN